MNCMKNPHYKSVVQTYGNSPQVLTAVATPLAIGGVITDSGVAIDAGTNGMTVKYGGMYEISGNAIIDCTAAGDVTIQIYIDGVALPETLRTITLRAGNEQIYVETTRYIDARSTPALVQIYASTDGTATGSVSEIQMLAEKIA